MAGDKKRFKGAMKHWESLREDGNFSVDAEHGITAVLCSVTRDATETSEEDKKAKKDARVLRKEALKICELRNDTGRETEVFFQPSRQDMADIIQDEKISDIIVIGHGNLRSLFLSHENEYTVYTWEDLSDATTHLKTGEFVQRFCGGINDRIAVPLGMFALADFGNIIAPIDTDFVPRGLQHPENQKLQRPFTRISPTYASISLNMRRLAY